MPGKSSTTPTETTFTLSHPPYTYFHLCLTSTPLPSSSKPSQSILDEISLRQYLTSALTQSFGITGSAIPLDILKVEGREGWVRVDSGDAELLHASLGQWCSAGKALGLRVLGRGTWLGGLAGVGGMDQGVLWSLER